MKKLTSALTAVLLLSAAKVDAQCVNTSSLNVSTGFDPVTQTYIGQGGLDPMWILTSAPPSTSGQTLGLNAPAHVIGTHSAWAQADFPGTDAVYISPYNTSWTQFEYDNYPLGTDVVFERTFCVCADDPSDSVTFDLRLNADNWGSIDLVYPSNIATNLITQSMPSSPPTSNFADNTPDTYNNTMFLPSGTYKLRAKLKNNLQVSGLSIYGTLTSSGLVSDNLCSATGVIAGYKFNDSNLNGFHDAGADPAVPNWTVELKDMSGNVIATTVTDATGFYSFGQVPVGNYVVEEVNQPGWTPVLPASGSYNVTVTANSVQNLTFLNTTGTISTPCDEKPDFRVTVFNCGVELNLLNLNLPSTYQIINTTWDMGDGQTMTGNSVMHYYDGLGVYNVCVTVTLFDGKECCVIKECKKVEIVRMCPDDCQIDARPDHRPNGCWASFTANPDLMGTPIVGYFWDFGDGNTSTEMNPVHNYVQSGSYTVSLFVFGLTPDMKDCCVKEFRMEVRVYCDEMNKTATSTAELNTTSMSDVKAYPNPAQDEFVVSFEATQLAPVQLTVVDLNGKVILQQTQGQIDVGINKINIGKNLPKGVFLLQIKQGDYSQMIKLIKQ